MWTWPSIGLAIAGDAGLQRHFAAELGPAGIADAAHLSDEILVVVRPIPAGAKADVRRGRHKTTGWRVRLGSPSDTPLACELGTRGVFGHSLVQSVVVEPLLSVAHARNERALISGAALVVDDRALVLVGGSRSGKSSLALRAWARGTPLMADDRVMVGPDGTATGVRRRLRVYPDLVATAPDAVTRLGLRTRIRLRGRGLVRRLSAGLIALPELVSPVGILDEPVPLPIGRIVVIDRHPGARPAGAGGIAETDAPDRVWARLAEILERDMDALAGHGPAWSATAARVRSTQLEILRQAVLGAGAPPSLISVPPDWSAGVAVARLARHLGLEP